MSPCRPWAPKLNSISIMEICLWYQEVVFYTKRTGEGFLSRWWAALGYRSPASQSALEREKHGLEELIKRTSPAVSCCPRAFGIIITCPFATEISSNNSGHWCVSGAPVSGRTKVRMGRKGVNGNSQGFTSCPRASSPPPSSVSKWRPFSPHVAYLRLDERR